MAVTIEVKAKSPTQRMFEVGIFASVMIDILVDGAKMVRLRDGTVKWSQKFERWFVVSSSRTFQDNQNQKQYLNYWDLLPDSPGEIRGQWTDQIMQQVQQQVPGLGTPQSVQQYGQQQPAPQQYAAPAAPQQQYAAPVAQAPMVPQAAPAAPVAPVAPMAPQPAPVAPAAPAVPVAPQPVAPGAPVTPMAPAAPAAPGVPTGAPFPAQPAPAAPAAPAAPGPAPAAPAAPQAPGQPPAQAPVPPGTAFPLPG